HTDFPAALSTSAAVAPPGSEPTMTTSKSGIGNLFIGVAARLHVAGKSDRDQTGELTVAAVLGRPVARFARMLEQQLLQLPNRAERRVLIVTRQVEEVAAEHLDSLAVDL